MTHKFGSIAIMAVLALAGQAMADGLVNISAGAAGFTGGNTYGGGAFTATRVSGPTGGYIGEFTGPRANASANSFQTFCIQLNENVSVPGGPYRGVISTFTRAAGNSAWNPITNSTDGNLNGQDTISSATALLYYQFRTGGNFGGLYTSSVTTTALTEALQLAFWYSEGELRNSTNPTTGVFSNATNANNAYNSNTLAQSLFAWAADSNNNLGRDWGVRVLQLWAQDATGAYTVFRQDQLTIVPLPPAAFAGLGTLAGVIGLGYIRRRRLANA